MRLCGIDLDCFAQNGAVIAAFSAAGYMLTVMTKVKLIVIPLFAVPVVVHALLDLGLRYLAGKHKISPEIAEVISLVVLVISAVVAVGLGLYLGVLTPIALATLAGLYLMVVMFHALASGCAIQKHGSC